MDLEGTQSCSLFDINIIVKNFRVFELLPTQYVFSSRLRTCAVSRCDLSANNEVEAVCQQYNGFT